MDKATLTQWNRLEPRPRQTNIEHSLKAEIRDPLWMLTRQWQMGEFHGEDTGTPVSSKIQYSVTSLDKIQLGKQSVLPVDRSIPLETAVERENADLLKDLHLSLRIRRQWQRLIKKTFSGNIQSSLLSAYDKSPLLTIETPDFISDGLSDFSGQVKSNPEHHEFLSALHNRAFHGGLLYLSLKENQKPLDLIDGVSLSVSDGLKLNDLAQELLDWFDTILNQQDEDHPNAWNDQNLEYQYGASAPEIKDDQGDLFLKAEEYYSGKLDWYSADYVEKKEELLDELSNDLNQNLVTEHKEEVFPAEIEFKGMPRSRWWEFEDGQLNFGAIKPTQTDTGKIIFAEFGLLYSNDWSILPLNLPYGSFTNIDCIVTRDTFGQYTISNHYKTYGNSNNWGLFQIYNPAQSTALQSDPLLFIPSVAAKILENEPVEKINFIRDEMANMVWAIEQIVPDHIGEGQDGYHHARQVREYYNGFKSAAPDKVKNEAKIKYTLATEVPENWIPFIPVKASDGLLEREIKLQRASMPRIIEGLEPVRILPRTLILSKPASPYFVFEEEVPRSGAIVQLTWQRTRMPDGKTVVWLGRKKLNGRGSGFSNLKYDQITSK